LAVCVDSAVVVAPTDPVDLHLRPEMTVVCHAYARFRSADLLVVEQRNDAGQSIALARNQ
jgi:hypothetical protein